MSSITNEGARRPGRQEWAIVCKVPGTGLDAARAARGRFFTFTGHVSAKIGAAPGTY